MSTNASSGMDTVFKRGTGASSPYTYAEIAEVTSINGPDKSRTTTDATHLKSGKYKDLIGGIREGGTVALSLNFIEAEYSKLNDDFESQVLGHYQVVFSDAGATIFEFDGWVTKLSSAVKVEGIITADCTITVSGPVTIIP